MRRDVSREVHWTITCLLTVERCSVAIFLERLADLIATESKYRLYRQEDLSTKACYAHIVCAVICCDRLPDECAGNRALAKELYRQDLRCRPSQGV